MKYLYLFIITFLVLNPLAAQTEEAEVTTYYLIRHAEKDRSDSTNTDSHLTETGKMRANQWRSIFSHISFDAIYSTDYNRTKETAEPTAEKNKLELQIYNPTAINFEKFLKETKGETVLIVGHSNTTPFFVNGIISKNKYDNMEDDNNANLYIVTIIEGEISDQVLLIN